MSTSFFYDLFVLVFCGFVTPNYIQQIHERRIGRADRAVFSGRGRSADADSGRGRGRGRTWTGTRSRPRLPLCARRVSVVL